MALYAIGDLQPVPGRGKAHGCFWGRLKGYMEKLARGMAVIGPPGYDGSARGFKLGNVSG